MYAIQFPIYIGGNGTEISNLQATLLWLYEQKIFKTFDSPNRPTKDELKALIANLAEEKSVYQFGDATRHLILYFQIQQGLGDHLAGVVEATTAARLNVLLKELGGLEAEPWRVQGHIRNAADDQGLPSLTVRAYDQDGVRETGLGDAMTDANGYYAIAFAEAAFRNTPAERGGPELFIRVFDPAGLVLGQSKRLNSASPETTINLAVSVPNLRVYGQVTRGDARPAPQVEIAAYDRDLRKRQLLGRATSDADGNYVIDYDGQAFALADLPTRRTPWLIVEAYDPATKTLLSHQELQYSNPLHRVDLNISPDLAEQASEWQRLTELIAPLLRGQGVAPGMATHHIEQARDLAPGELNDADIDFIVRETGLDPQRVRDWASSHAARGEALLALNGEPAADLQALTEHGWSFFYGLKRLGLGPSLLQVFARPPTDWISAWHTARHGNLVPDIPPSDMEMLTGALARISRLRQVDPGQNGNHPVVRILERLGRPLPNDLAVQAFELFERTDVLDPQPLKGLIDAHPNHAPAFRGLVRGLRLNRLVTGYPTLESRLEPHLDDNDDTLAPLARMPLSQWTLLAGDAGLPVANILHVKAQVERTYPLQALQGRLDDASLTTDSALQKKLRALLKKDGEKIDQIMHGRTPILAAGNTNDGMQFLTDIGRYARLGVNLEIAAALVNVGIKTPADLIKYDAAYLRDILREQFGELDLSEHLNELHGTIGRYVDGGIEISVTGSHVNLLPPGMYEIPPPLSGEVRENLPTIPALFGDQDECACPPCASVLGQEAYLVDLLQLISKKPASGSAPIVALDQRRPDIQNLPLSCDNANTPIQHIDLVLEILEGACAPGTTPPTTAEQAYQQAATAGYPWILPFDSDHANARLSIERLGMPRLALMRLLGTPSREIETAETLAIPYSLSGNSLRPTGPAWQLWTTTPSGDTVWHRYGLVPDNAHRVTITDPASRELLTQMPVDSVARRISILLDRTGLTLEAFETLIATAYVGRIGIANRAQCKTSQMTLDTGTHTLADCLSRIHRFVRLQRAMPDWHFDDLDAAVAINRDLHPDNDWLKLLTRLAHMQRIVLEFDFPIRLLTAFPSSIPAIATHLGLRAGQFDLLARMAGLNRTVSRDTWDQIERLLRLHRQRQACDWPVEDLALAILPRAEIETRFHPIPSSLPSRTTIDALLVTVAERLLAAGTIDPLQPLVAQAERQLAEIFDRAETTAILNGIVDAGSENAIPLDTARQDGLVDLLTQTPAHPQLGQWHPLLSQAEAVALFAVATVLNPGVEPRLTTLLDALAARRREHELVRTLSQSAMLPEAFVAALLKDQLPLDPAGGQTEQAHTRFLDASFYTATPPQDAKLWTWVDRLLRLSTLYRQSPVGSTLSKAPSITLPWQAILANLPSTGLAPHHTALIDLGWLGDPLRMGCPTLQALGVASDLSSAVATLAARYELPVAQIERFAQTAGITAVDHCRSPAHLKRLHDLLAVALKLGATSTELADLANPAGNGSAAVLARNLLGARLGDAASAAYRKLDDQLRRSRRDALVGLLIQRYGHADANSLYDAFLIDPMVQPCLETTRILEAITATQLLAHRVLLGIEPGVQASAALRQQWPWMRNYRVWEANRRVYLTPENWLYPELRDDKSSSFKQLESELTRGELTDEIASEAFGKFLDNVAEVSRIEVLGLFEDLATQNLSILRDADGLPQKRILYAVGRTPHMPYHYYWRKAVDFGSRFMEWSPWERIELDIQSDHLLPFILDDKLHIAWPVIKHTEGQSQQAGRWEVRMAWSRRDGEGWKKTNISRDYASLEDIAFMDERWSFSFRCASSNDGRSVSIQMFALDKIGQTSTTKPPSVMGDLQGAQLPFDYSPASASDSTRLNRLASLIESNSQHLAINGNLNAQDNGRLKALVADNYPALPAAIKDHMEVYMMAFGDWCVPPGDKSYELSGGDPLYGNIRTNGFNLGLFANPGMAIFRHKKARDQDNTALQGALFRSTVPSLLPDYLRRLYGTTGEYGFVQFVDDLQKACSIRTLSCQVWLRVPIPNSGQTDLVQLDGQRGTFTCAIEGQYLRPGPTVTLIRLGKQESISLSMSLTVSGLNSPLTSTQVETAAEVPAGKMANQTLVFEINGTALSASQLSSLGINLQDSRSLSLRKIFTLTRLDQAEFVDPAPPIQLASNRVDNALPWMNGYLEKTTASGQAGNFPVQVRADSGGTIECFAGDGAALPGGQFWMIGSAGKQDFPSTIWHYSEKGVARYIDLDQQGKLSRNGLQLYPDAFPEAADRRADWATHDTLDVPGIDTQACTFAADAKPTATTLATSAWEQAKLGKLAYDHRMPYACYNWEIFFHAPLLIADQLSKQHRFEDAERWLRFVFDPTSSDPGNSAKRYLKFQVFCDLDLRNQTIEDLKALAQAAAGFHTTGDVAAVRKIIQRWRNTPFRPFVIARGRPIAFLWRTIFAYLDNLIAWADSLYRRDTRESNNEAMMLYVFAQKILGRRPARHDSRTQRPSMTYRQLAGKLDDFANYWVDVGSRIRDPIYHGGKLSKLPPPSSTGMLYFCVPPNDKILGYWSTIDDRLFNLRHCRNLDGVARELPLVDAPIDPELLVRATAAGVDLGSAIAGLYAAPPHYRYAVLAGRAGELAAAAKALAGELLSAFEKRDAEQIAQLRSAHDITLLALNREVRSLQITEAERNLEALRASRRSTGARYLHYQRLLGKKSVAVPAEGQTVGEDSLLGQSGDGLTSAFSKFGLIESEISQILSLGAARAWSDAESVANIVASVFNITASGFHIAAATMPIGGERAKSAGDAMTALGSATTSIGASFRSIGQFSVNDASHHALMAGHIRRRDDWAFQSNMTLKELQQIDRQILANEIRLAITHQERDIQVQQLEQASAMDTVLREKFTNAQLYEWMAGELYGLYDQTFRLAMDLGRQAQRAAERELGNGPLNAIGNTHWSSRRQGLLAAEKLMLDLKRLDQTYLDQNQRELELTKHISLKRLDPKALLQLKTTDLNDANEPINACIFELPEWLFDLDTPGHYLRRIKSVSISIPSVVGPYTNIHGRLTLLSSQIRHDRSPTQYPRPGTGDDPRFTDRYGSAEQIVTSSGNADSGLFEAQLRDERFLPFEGHGAISRWRLELPAQYKQFDYTTISDVIIHLRYTARDGGEQLAAAARGSIANLPGNTPTKRAFPVLLSCRTDFPLAWSNRANSLQIRVLPNHLPYWMCNGHLVANAAVCATVQNAVQGMPSFLPATITDSTASGTTIECGTVVSADDLLVLLFMTSP